VDDRTDLPDPSAGDATGDPVDRPVEPGGESVHAGDEPAAVTADEKAERTYPSTVGGLAYLVMLAVAFAGVLVVVLGDWRVGVRIFAGVLVAGALLRVALPTRDAGMLAVRGKGVDAVLLLVVGAALLLLASSIPDQPV